MEFRAWPARSTSGAPVPTAPAARGPLRAHLLLQVAPETADAVHGRLGQVPGVVDVAVTTGAFDLMIQVEVADQAGLRRVLKAARAAPELVRLCLCLGSSQPAQPVLTP